MKLTDFPEIAAQWHPTKNGDWLLEDVAASSNKVASWLCEVCDQDWDAIVSNRTRKGYGCPRCAGRMPIVGVNDLTTANPELAAQLHPTKNGNLTAQDLMNSSGRKVWWSGDIYGHNDWQATVASRTQQGSGCPQCSGRVVIAGKTDLETVRPDIAAEWHPIKNGNLKPSMVTVNSNRKVWWLCKTCGHDWKTSPNARVGNSRGCAVCVNQVIIPGRNDLLALHPGVAAEWHPTKNENLTPDMVGAGSTKNAWWLCKNGHDWEASPNTRAIKGYGCRQCFMAGKTSKQENGIVDFIRALGLKFEQNNRKVLAGKEIDIYLPEHKVGIEYNGLYWHTEQQLGERFYHRDKWLNARNAGVVLIQIWEDQWLDDPKGVKAMLKKALAISDGSPVVAPEVDSVVTDNCTADHVVYERAGFVAAESLEPTFWYFTRDKRKNKAELTEKQLAGIDQLPRIWDAGKTRWINPSTHAG